MSKSLIATLLCIAACSLLLASTASAGRFSCENRCQPTSPCALGCDDQGFPSTCGQAGYACVDYVATAPEPLATPAGSSDQIASEERAADRDEVAEPEHQDEMIDTPAASQDSD